MNRGGTCRSVPALAASSRGFTMIELMVAMLLGLIVIGGVASVFLANQQTYRTNQALGDVQDGSRLAFEMLAHDIRNAQLTGCNNNARFSNVLNNGPSSGGTVDWWANWGNALVGYGGTQTDPAVGTGTGETKRVSGTESIAVLAAADTGMSVASHAPASSSSTTSPNFTINGTGSDLQAGDVVIVCDPDHATILKLTSYTDSSKTIAYDATNNCSTGLGYPTVCVSKGTPYTFGSNALIAKLAAVDWYIGTNKLGGRSLYRGTLVNNAGALSMSAQEMVRNVTSMTITYLPSGGTSFVAPTAVTSWGAINAVQVTLNLQSADQLAGTNAKPISRTFTTTATLRNRVN